MSHHERVAGHSIFESKTALLKAGVFLFRIITATRLRELRSPDPTPSWYAAQREKIDVA